MTDKPPPSRRQFKLRQFIPLLILIIALILFFASGLHHYFTFSELKSHHEALHHWKNQHYLLAAGAYMMVYLIAVAVSIPGATLLTLIGGFLFGHWFGTMYVVISATLGSAIVFIAAKTAFATMLEAKAGPKIHLLKKGFHEDAMSYLLFLRLVPIFPFWLINIVPGLLAIPLRTFLIATFIGIIPGSFVYVWVGSGLNTVFAENETLKLNSIFTPHVLLPILALALLSLMPILYKRLKKRKSHG